MITEMRAKGTGTVLKIKGKYYARWREAGQAVYGKACDTRDEAELDRIKGYQSTTQKLAKKEIPTFQVWAYLHMCEGTEQYDRYGAKMKGGSFQLNETIRIKQIEGSKLGKKKLNRITDQDIQEWVDAIQKEVFVWKDGKRVVTGFEPASPSWKRRCYAYVSKLFTLARKAKLIQSSPCFAIELPEVPERLNTILSLEQSTGLYERIDRTGAMMIIANDAGLRADEIRRILWTDITPEGIRVRNAKNADRKDLVPINDQVRKALNAQPKRGIFVFSTGSGSQMSLRNMKRDVRKRMRELGISDDVRPFQDLRGTFTTELIQSGVDIKTTQNLARHASAKTTIKSYLRSNPQVQSEALEMVQKRKGLANKVSEPGSISKSG